MNLELREARAADAPVIVEFNCAMAKETESVTLDPERAALGVAAVLRDPARGFYLIAAAGDRIAGQLMITFEWSDWRNGNFWWIQSVYVHPDYRRQGVFRALYSAILQRAREAADVCGVRLYVERDNERAQRAYRELGMREAPYRMFEVDFVLGETER